MTVETIDAGPRRTSRRVVVQAPAAELFALLSDPHRHHEVDGSGTVQAKVAGPRQVEVGSTFTTSMRQFGVPYRIRNRVVAYEQDRLVEWRHPVGHTWRWELEATSPTTTTVTETWDASRTPAYPVFAVTGTVGRNARGIERTLERLRARATG